MKIIDVKTLAIWLLSTMLLMTIGFCIYVSFQLEYFKQGQEDFLIEKHIYEGKIEVLDKLIMQGRFQMDNIFDPLLEHNYERQHEMDSLIFAYKFDSLESLGGEK